MEQPEINSPRSIAIPLFGKSGLVSSGGSGNVAFETGVGEVMMTVMMGAFFGLIAGLIVTNLLRYLSLFAGRSLGGHSWAIYGALLGALIFGWISLVDDES